MTTLALTAFEPLAVPGLRELTATEIRAVSGGDDPQFMTLGEATGLMEVYAGAGAFGGLILGGIAGAGVGATFGLALGFGFVIGYQTAAGLAWAVDWAWDAMWGGGC